MATAPHLSEMNASHGPSVAYPEPIGFQAEWNIGRGPTLNGTQTAVEVDTLTGGYAMLMARHKLRKGELWPFARWNYYTGGYKTERNAPVCGHPGVGNGLRVAVLEEPRTRLHVYHH
ncbi:MAG UNVERIFIED_CONTAM: hypothetical protein LVR18_26385 [Planctomycetaceae bacterium]|jgi:hypothetical protein